MTAALLLLLTLAAPFQRAADACCLSAGDSVEGAAAHLGVDHLGTEPLGRSPCDSEDSCPTGECCAVCASCCKVAVRSLVPLGFEAPVDPPRFPPTASSLYAADPGCSVWHPPRG